jgi:apolipoprotein D and lipocalin family protein
MRLLSALLALSALAFSQASAATATPPTTVDAVNLTKYVGHWYQVADVPQFYETLTCRDCATADYSLNSDGSVGVINTSKGPFGSNCTIKGAATPVSAGKFSIKLNYLPGVFPNFGGDYWILALGPVNDEDQYSWSLVSDSKRASLYILSRTVTLADDVYGDVLKIVEEEGFDATTLKLTDQSCYTQ